MVMSTPSMQIATTAKKVLEILSSQPPSLTLAAAIRALPTILAHWNAKLGPDDVAGLLVVLMK